MRNKRSRNVVTPYNRLVALFRYQDKDIRWRDRLFRTVSLRAAQELELTGQAQKVIRWIEGVPTLVGYQAMAPIRAERPSPTTLTFHTLQCVSGEVDHPSEVLKYLVWPLIGDHKAVAVRPRISAAERRVAEKLLAPGRRYQVRALTGMLTAA